MENGKAEQTVSTQDNLAPPMSVEEAIQKASQLVTEEIISKLGSKDWHERLEG